jgi:hypothetical protein
MFKFWKSGSSGPTLSDLPRDLVINELLQWLQPEDLCDISQTCKGLSYLRHDNAAWFKILSETNLSNWRGSFYFLYVCRNW